MNFKRRLSLALESVIDKPRETLCPAVWVKAETGQYTLRPEVSTSIYQGMLKFDAISSISKVIVIGGISTYNYSDDSDIDVNVEVPEATDEQLSQIYKLVQTINGVESFLGHPLNWWASTKLDQTRYDSAYDVINDRWVNGPNRIEIDLYKYIDQFEYSIKKIDLNKSKLVHDIISLDVISNLDVGSRKQIGELVSRQLREINRDVIRGQHLYDKIIDNRREAFANPDPEKLRIYKTKSSLPENIIYLLLRKYCYMSFLKKLDDLDSPLDMKDIGRVFKAATGDICST